MDVLSVTNSVGSAPASAGRVLVALGALAPDEGLVGLTTAVGLVEVEPGAAVETIGAEVVAVPDIAVPDIDAVPEIGEPMDGVLGTGWPAEQAATTKTVPAMASQRASREHRTEGIPITSPA